MERTFSHPGTRKCGCSLGSPHAGFSARISPPGLWGHWAWGPGSRSGIPGLTVSTSGSLCSCRTELRHSPSRSPASAPALPQAPGPEPHTSEIICLSVSPTRQRLLKGSLLESAPPAANDRKATRGSEHTEALCSGGCRKAAAGAAGCRRSDSMIGARCVHLSAGVHGPPSSQTPRTCCRPRSQFTL